MDIKQIFTIVLGLHVVGHAVTGVLINFTSVLQLKSWVLESRMAYETLKMVNIAGWVIISLIFTMVTYGYMNNISWWSSLAWGGVVLSILYLVTFFDAFTFNLPIQGMIGNIVIIAALLGLIHV